MAAPLLHFAALVLLAPAWYWAGRACQRLRLPLITGIMLAGAASGPQALGLLSNDALASLTTVDHVCLSLIALAAGAELQLSELRKLRRQVVVLTLSISACSWLAVFACFQLIAPRLTFMAPLHGRVAAAVASLAATIGVARSPASAIAVLREVDGKGPYSSLVMAIVVVKDVLVFVAFSVNIELARLASKSAAAELEWAQLLQPLASVAMSGGLGAAAGYLLAAVLHRRPALAAGPSGGSSAAAAAAAAEWEDGPLGRLRAAAPLVVSGGTFVAAEAVGAEPLLACVTAGLVVANSRWVPAGAPGQDATAVLASELGVLMPGVNSIFFGLVGASVRPRAMHSTAWAAALLAAARLAGIWAGCHWGAAAGDVPLDVGRRLWMGMVTQAGIALGLARIVARRFESWGPDLASMLAGVVLLNLAAGPPLFRSAVVATGEARALAGGPLLPGGGSRAPSSGLDGATSGSELSRRKLIPIIDSHGLQGEW